MKEIKLMFFQRKLLLKKKVKKSIKSLQSAARRVSSHAEQFSCILKLLLIPEKEVEVDFKKKLGKGSYGKVYEGTYNGEKVAIKEVGPELEPILAEGTYFLTIRRTRTDHVIHMFGVTKTPKGNYALVLELADTSLETILERTCVSSTRKQLDILIQVARGINDLHTIGLVHGDLKSGNILSVGKVFKLTDFGLARVKMHSAISRRTNTHTQRGTLRWMAPEVLHGMQSISRQSDMFSFGMVMYEVITGKVPYGELNNELQIMKADKPQLPEAVQPKIRELFEACISNEPEKRPTADKAIEILTEILDQLPEDDASALSDEELNSDEMSSSSSSTDESDPINGYLCSSDTAESDRETREDAESTVSDTIEKLTPRIVPPEEGTD
ncbi:MAG: protein kinase domain-containing protein, partial [Thermotogota bacterium]